MTLKIDPARYLPQETREFYKRGAQALTEAGIPFLVGGAYALGSATGIERHTKDFDLFIKKKDVEPAMRALETIGCRTEFTFPHWLAKGFAKNGDFIDLIFSSGNGVAPVDDDWFTRAKPETILGIQLQVCPFEEIIWQKAFIMERERCDVADVAHLVRACAEELDWDHLLRRFDRNWRVLFSHLVVFGFIYPGERQRIPARVMHELIGRLSGELITPYVNGTGPSCRGTLLSRQQYLIDVNEWGYHDVRRDAEVHMNEEDIALWTAGIAKDGTKENV
jgi:hypothetical protein